MSLQDLPLMTLHCTEQRLVGSGPQRQIERVPLKDVTTAMAQHPALGWLGQSALAHRLPRNGVPCSTTPRTALPWALRRNSPLSVATQAVPWASKAAKGGNLQGAVHLLETTDAVIRGRPHRAVRADGYGDPGPAPPRRAGW